MTSAALAPDASIWKSIWSAASLPECRAPTLLEPCAVERVAERHHLDRAHRSIPAFVASLGAGALDRLLDAVGRQDAHRDRYSGAERDGGDALRDFARDVLEVRCGPANDRREGDHAVDLLGGRQAVDDQRDLPRTRDADDGDELGLGAVAQERVGRAFDEPVDDEV